MPYRSMLAILLVCLPFSVVAQAPAPIASSQIVPASAVPPAPVAPLTTPMPTAAVAPPVPVALVAPPSPAPGETVGCFHYNYAYAKFLSGKSTFQNTTGACQKQCQMTSGCVAFTWWEAPKNECDLSGTGITLKPTTTTSGGAISGPRKCPVSTCLQAQPACSELPGPGFPATTSAASAAAWPDGQQPTNAQCWPRDYSGFPTHCTPLKVTILEDHVTGWAGKCQGLNEQVVPPGETCQSICLKNVLCSVWQEVNYTDPPQCWQGSFGYNCYENRPGFYPTSAQRVMHGSYRVLLDLTGRQVMGLSKMFSPSNMFHNATLAANHCKLICIANLGCQYWLYSTLSGCWVENPGKERVPYPLTIGSDSSVTGTDAANAVIAGEMIQHYCGMNQGHCGDGVTPPPPAPVYTAPPSPLLDHLATLRDQGSGWPFNLPTWAVTLLSLLLLCFVGGAVGAAAMLVKKRKSTSYALHDHESMSSGGYYE